MAKVHLPPPTWNNYLSGRAALLEMMTEAGRKKAGPPPPRPLPKKD